MATDTCAAAQYLTSADVARIANQRGDSLTAAGVRLAAATGRLLPAATTANGVRLFARADVDAFLAARAAKTKQRATGAAA